MRMYVIATELGADWAGPYTDQKLLQKTFGIIKQIDPGAEVISKDTDPYGEQIGVGLRPYHIRVELENGEPQLPADVQLTWPPAETEGIQKGTPDYILYFVWAKDEKAALLKLARLNRATPKAAEEVLA